MRHRLAYNIASAEDNALFTAYVDVVVIKKINNACGGARQEAIVTDEYFTYVFGMKCVYVLLRGDSIDNALLIDVRRERELNENAVNLWVVIELVYA